MGCDPVHVLVEKGARDARFEKIVDDEKKMVG